jgi:hypothetical protein
MAPCDRDAYQANQSFWPPITRRSSASRWAASPRRSSSRTPVRARCSRPPHGRSTHAARSGSRLGCRTRRRASRRSSTPTRRTPSTRSGSGRIRSGTTPSPRRSLSRLRRRDARVGARDSPALPAARRPSGTDLARAGAPVDVHRCQRRPHDPARLAATHGSRPPWRRANRDPDRSLPKRLSARSAGRDPRRRRGTRLGPGCCAATTAAQSFHVACKRI